MSVERQERTEVSPWWGEHVHRYQIVIPHLKPAFKVLDIACGNGYGTAILAKAVNKGQVFGADVVPEVLAEDREYYSNVPNIEFLLADATNLNFPNDTFDVVVSYETIEHVEDFNKMLSELRRVLKPGGILFLSTPNFPVNSPGGKLINPYHVREFVYKEMIEMFDRHFLNEYKVYGQRYARYLKQKGFAANVAQILEWLMYRRGIRKLPISFQNAIIKPLIGKTMYPLPEDYDLVSEQRLVEKCKNFIVTAHKI